ncbi:hypothetical protein SPI_03118 [Niveomyces insectorum RCEF 264]|uniref:Basic proline-rich protein n=1 Tax=Niveomyces insectorum RCEF 264 TaxID=1081102 RepID=A0A167X309_9HYPO|nr:hypothetical protein SPI_03118 [Niveomyces insectorum RCEF 264]
MESVPETERMEEFRSSPLPTLRLQSASSFAFPSPSSLPPGSPADADPYPRKLKPPNMRRSTEPPSPSSPSWSSPSLLPYRPRTTSPLSGSHTRSRSTTSAGSLYAPGMSRTRSMPGVNGAGHLQFASDPRASNVRLANSAAVTSPHRPPSLNTRTPRKTLVEDVFPSSPTRVSVIHDADRPLHERNSAPNLGTERDNTGSTPAAAVSLPLARTRRPSSPYRRLSATPATPGSTSTQAASTTATTIPIATTTTTTAAAPTVSTAASASNSISSDGSSAAAMNTLLSSAGSSPLHRPSDTFLSAPSYSVGGLSSSSVPSTPTSTRSRSPSISSLETIPDSPDAEEAALEAERIAQLKAAADAVDSSDNKNRSGGVDVPARGRTLGFGSRDKRKRWSVCGAERRGDLDLETIWED